jgi:hypothetical protein
MARKYTVEIKAIPPVAFAVPGIRKVEHGDTVRFKNSTRGPIEIRMAASGVLKGLTYSRKKQVDPGEISEPFEIVADSGTHEYSVHYEYEDAKAKKIRRGFAIGASSPKIIVVPPRDGRGSTR